MARPFQDPQIRITEILDTAEHLFTVKGYFGTTISNIAKEMGVTQGMFYYYFKSKEEILEALLNRQVTSNISEIKDMVSS
ncbi:MAG: transcriptional regulator, TetR family, partial [Sporomusa sp.]|nr:transcriptional regulator, TetR family [Sporomusa sp.]